MAEMTKRFTDYGIASATYVTVPLYCAFSKEKSKAYNKFKHGNYDAQGITYKRDEYWNVSATIPSQASVLLMSSKLDPQTPHKYAKHFLKSIRLDPEDLASETCGMKILASYVSTEGDLAALDKSCVDEMPRFNMTLLADYQGFFGVEDAYNGILDTSSSSN
ncbi:hypothetical protein JG688_00012868 [Phytophthora aleatoria]|uniref:Uncharacterized protein n=1 Tax=Phytophthora aleatoria TaxID=2496075 RepID=A0A8J5IND1_9STRA|nr:hypothetical protein JG688_00012868 [Phytophthora aleatoria]